jgi:hypothetical protein
LQLEVVAPFFITVDQALADQHAGGEQNSFECQNRRKQRERIFIKSVMGKRVAEDDPADDERALKKDKLDSADEPADPVKYAMVNREGFFILLFEAIASMLWAAGLSSEPLPACISSRPCLRPVALTSLFSRQFCQPLFQRAPALHTCRADPPARHPLNVRSRPANSAPRQPGSIRQA